MVRGYSSGTGEAGVEDVERTNVSDTGSETRSVYRPTKNKLSEEQSEGNGPSKTYSTISTETEQ